MGDGGLLVGGSEDKGESGEAGRGGVGDATLVLLLPLVVMTTSGRGGSLIMSFSGGRLPLSFANLEVFPVCFFGLVLSEEDDRLDSDMGVRRAVLHFFTGVWESPWPTAPFRFFVLLGLSTCSCSSRRAASAASSLRRFLSRAASFACRSLSISLCTICANSCASPRIQTSKTPSHSRVGTGKSRLRYTVLSGGSSSPAGERRGEGVGVARPCVDVEDSF